MKKPAFRTVLLAVAALSSEASSQDSVTVTATTAPQAWIAPDDAFSIVVRGGGRGPGKYAIVIGSFDATALFTSHNDTLSWRPTGIGLPAGEHELVVYLVDDEHHWERIGATPLRVRNRAGFEKAVVQPAMALASRGHVASGEQPAQETSPMLGNVTMVASLQSTHVRQGWSFRTQSNFAGASNREETLRFAERQQRAPKVDLADYLISAEHGPTNVALGHVSFGQQRHLVNAFASRGASASVRLGDRSTFSLAALNGSTIVGFSNLTGLSQSQHRIAGGSLGFEALPSRPGALRVEATAVDGTVLPQSGFNRGAITDAETSVGTGMRLQVSDPGLPVRIDAGFSRSKSDYLPDSTLSAGAPLTGVKHVARNARYLDLTADVLRGAMLAHRLPVSVSMVVRTERVDPLYRSVAAGVRPDVSSRAIELQGMLGPVAIQGSLSQLRDNLGHIASILSTRTDASSFAVDLPLATIARQGAWLPSVSVAVQRTRQAGDSIPPNSGFAATHVPDQLNAVGTVALQWNAPRWNARFQFNTSDQDNRQAGRENADLWNATRLFSLGLTPLERISLMLEYGVDGSRNTELGQESNTRRWAANLQAQPFATSTVSATYARTANSEQPTASAAHNDDLRVEWQQRLMFVRFPGSTTAPQAFMRYARNGASSSGPAVDPFRQQNWSLTTGLTLPIH